MIRALRLYAIALVGLAEVAVAAPTTEQQTRANGLFAQPPATMIFPQDLADERRFPLENPKEVDEVQYINNYVNLMMTYVTDDEHYHERELWVMAPDDLKGDCEDFAMTKLYMLGDMAGVENSRLEAVIVHWRDKYGRHSDGHAILAYRFTHGTVVYLDINYPRLMTKAELIDQGYEFQNW